MGYCCCSEVVAQNKTDVNVEINPNNSINENNELKNNALKNNEHENEGKEIIKKDTNNSLNSLEPLVSYSDPQKELK